MRALAWFSLAAAIATLGCFFAFLVCATVSQFGGVIACSAALVCWAGWRAEKAMS